MLPKKFFLKKDTEFAIGPFLPLFQALLVSPDRSANARSRRRRAGGSIAVGALPGGPETFFKQSARPGYGFTTLPWGPQKIETPDLDPSGRAERRGYWVSINRWGQGDGVRGLPFGSSHVCGHPRRDVGPPGNRSIDPDQKWCHASNRGARAGAQSTGRCLAMNGKALLD